MEQYWELVRPQVSQSIGDRLIEIKPISPRSSIVQTLFILTPFGDCARERQIVYQHTLYFEFKRHNSQIDRIVNFHCQSGYIAVILPLLESATEKASPALNDCTHQFTVLEVLTLIPSSAASSEHERLHCFIDPDLLLMFSSSFHLESWSSGTSIVWLKWKMLNS